MPKVTFQDILPYKAADLYDLVMDVERYTEIFDDIKYIGLLCEGPNRLSVDVRAGAGLESLSYRCDISGTPPEKIMIEATEGDFETMRAQWHFHALPDGRTKVRYDMSFDFGGLGFKNAAAQLFIDAQSEKIRADLKRYAGEHLPEATPPFAGGPAPSGPGPG